MGKPTCNGVKLFCVIQQKKGSFDRTISQCCYFAIACISYPFIKSASLLDMVMIEVFFWLGNSL